MLKNVKTKLEMGINVAMVDITKEAGLSGRFMVTALPTFYYGRNGEFRRYNGQRNADAMHEYVDSKLWQDAEPVWWVRHPDSILMTLMSWLFKTSIVMKGVRDKLTEDYGLSTWMSYVVFGAGTVVTGLVLGLVLVCIVDCISPSKEFKKPAQPQASSSRTREEAQPEEEKTSAEEEKQATETEEEAEDDGASSSVAEDEQDDSGSQKSQASARASQTSSRASQEWETIRDFEVADAEKEIQQQQSSQDGLCQRKSTKAPGESASEAGDTEEKAE